jgi:hypothetical protein
LLNGTAESTGRHAVTPGIETRPGNEEVYICAPKFCQNACRELVLVLDGVIITADERQRYARISER